MPRVAIDVLLKREILDPEGRAVERALPGLGYGTAHDVRIGKHVELDLDVDDEQELADTVERMANGLLTNPVIETWTWRIIGDVERADHGT